MAASSDSQQEILKSHRVSAINHQPSLINLPQSRREFLRLGAGVALGSLLPSGLAAREPSPDFSFVVANDLHYRDKRCAEWFQAVTASIRALRPRPAFVLLNGDLSEEGTPAQLGAMRELFWSLPMPVHATMGNHDYSHDERRANFERELRGARNFRFRQNGEWEFLCLDTTYGHRLYRSWITGETLAWVDANVPRIARDKPLVVFSHFPLGRNWLRPLNTNQLVERLRGHNVRHVFCGHWHGWTERRQRAVPVTTGRCCSWWRTNHDRSDERGYFLSRVTGDTLLHEFVAVPVPRNLV